MPYSSTSNAGPVRSIGWNKSTDVLAHECALAALNHAIAHLLDQMWWEDRRVEGSEAEALYVIKQARQPVAAERFLTTWNQGL